MTRFTGKRILITGATSGIGRAGAVRAASEGARLLLTGTNSGRLGELQDTIPEAIVLANDAADPASAADLADRVAAGGPLDGLWLNAGYADVAPIEHTDAAFFDRMMATNVRGPLLQLTALAPHLTGSASIVVTASTAAYEGSPSVAVYAATKAALVAMVRCWAAELAMRGIRVNTLVPGPIDTDFRGFMAPQDRDDFESGVLDRVPLARVGSAEEAAAVGLFLLSDESSYVTASQYFADGGLTRH